MIGAHALARNRLMCTILFDHLAVLGRGESLGNQQQDRQDQSVDEDGHYHRGDEPSVLVVDPSAQQVPRSAREKEAPKNSIMVEP